MHCPMPPHHPSSSKKLLTGAGMMELSSVHGNTLSTDGMRRSWPTLAKPTLAKPTLANFSVLVFWPNFVVDGGCLLLCCCCCIVVVVLLLCGSVLLWLWVWTPDRPPPDRPPPDRPPPDRPPPDRPPPDRPPPDRPPPDRPNFRAFSSLSCLVV